MNHAQTFTDNNNIQHTKDSQETSRDRLVIKISITEY